MKSLLTILLLLLLAASGMGAEVTVTDAFDARDTDRWVVYHGDWQVRDGACHVSGVAHLFLREMTFDDLSLEVDCRISDHGPIEADWIGVMLGGDSTTGMAKGYLVYIRYSGAVELYCAGEILAMKATGARAKFDAGQYVRLGITVQGKQVTVRVDDEVMIEEQMPDYECGELGLAAYDIEGDFDNFTLVGNRLGNMIRGEVLHTPSYQPAPGATVEIYNSMDGYDSPVTRSALADQQGRFTFSDLPTGEKAYWLRAGKPGFGATTAWFVTSSPDAPTEVELHLVGSPAGNIWIDSSSAQDMDGFRQVDDIQCFGGSRLEIKTDRPRGERAEFSAAFEFETPQEGDYIPHIAAGLYSTPHYWSDFRWALDDGEAHRASETLAIEGPRYGDRSTLVWARGPVQRLTRGKHTLRLSVRDPAPYERPDGRKAYWWSFDAAALAEAPVLLSPVAGQAVSAPRPKLSWRATQSATRTTVQYSQEPDFSNATVTIGDVEGKSFIPPRALADGTYYWRIKALTEDETPFPNSFTEPASFVVATDAPAISGVRIASRTPTSVVIRWRTDEPCVSRVRYGLSGLEPTRSAPAAGTPRRLHSARLTGLEAMTYYYLWIEAPDADGNAATSLRRGFCTPRGPIGDKNSPFGMFGQALTYASAMGEAGVRWYSDYWSWAGIEPSRGEFNWAEPEAMMKRAAEAGVNLTVTFWGTPAWIRPSHPHKFTYGPDDLHDAREFFRQVAGHCKGRTNWWLPWIEPNVARDTLFGFPEGYWANRPHARSYASYQRAAYEGAKAGDPDCRVVGMNTAGVDLGFIRKCYDEGAADSFDVMNVHYYAAAAPFEQQKPELIFDRLRALMAEYGDGEKPILCSEGGGASSNIEGTTEATQADNLIRIYVISIANNIDKLCWTFDRDIKPYDSKRRDMIMWMGLFRFHPDATADNPCGEPKPAYFALKTMTEHLRGTEYVGPVELGEGLRAYRFAGRGSLAKAVGAVTRPRPSVIVAWAEQGEADAEIPVGTDRVTIVNRMGERREAVAQDGKLRLRLTESPVFICR